MRHLPAGLLALLAVAASAPADEGMWPFNHIPVGQIEQAHGAKLSQSFLRRVQGASVRLNNGGSGSFVSPGGLLMTNHHVASDCIKKLSSKEKDYIRDGFLAADLSGEMKCPDLELNVLLEIETVTERVNRDLRPEMSEKERYQTQRAATADIEKECKDQSGLRCDVVKLYEGGIFDLYKYKRYTDARLVFAPEFSAAFFGGDPDNFTYPRYCLDVAFLRVYEDGKPVAPPAYLPWSRKGAAESELVFVSGHPGRTNRLLTEAQLHFERDLRIPLMLDWLGGMAQALRAYRDKGGEAARLARDELFRIDNSIKAYTGMLGGLRGAALMRKKSEQEKSLRQSIDSDPEKKKQYAGAWEAIAKAQQAKTKIYQEYRLLGTLGFYSRYFSIARDLYRLSDELPKANAERLPEYRESRLDSLYQRLFSPAPIYNEVEKVKLTQSLTFLRDRLGARHEMVRAVLLGRSPAEAAKDIIEATQLQDVALRKQLAADQAAEAKTSTDSMVRLVRSIDEEARRLRQQYEDEVEAVENAHASRIAQARFAALGTNVYPDATFTLRLSVGVVKSYQEQGRRIAPFTRIRGLYEKATGKDPYILAPRFAATREKVNLNTPYNLVSTNDITGGNSGSPLVNARAEVVGLIFDGNIQSLPNGFLYSETQARSVSVDSRGIMESLRNVYRATRIVSELEKGRLH